MKGQLTLNLAKSIEAKEYGLTAVELEHESFVVLMRKVAQEFSRLHGSVTSDDLRVLVSRWGLTPGHSNAWGAIFRGTGWRCIDRTRSAVKSNHAREIKVWRWEEYPNG